MKKKIFIVQMLDSKNPSGKSFTQVNDALFYSNDTDAHLVFLPHEQEGFEFNEATVALYNIDDASLVERPATIETFEGRKAVVLKMSEDILAHWGRWQAQVVFKQGDKINTSVVVKFDTLRYMLDQRPPTLRDVIKVDELYSQLVTVMDEIAGKDVISAPEIILARGGENTLGERLDKEYSEVATQSAEISGARGGFNTLGERLNDTTAQLAQTEIQMTQVSSFVQGYDGMGTGQNIPISVAFPTVTLEQVKQLDESATLSDSADWYVLQKLIYDGHRSTPRKTRITFPQGTFILTKTLSFFEMLLDCHIEAKGTTLKAGQGFTDSMILFGNPVGRYTFSRRYTIKGLRIDGNFTAKVGIDLNQNGNENLFQNVFVSNCEVGIAIAGVYYGEFSSNTIVQNCFIGIQFNRSTSNEVNTILFSNIKINFATPKSNFLGMEGKYTKGVELNATINGCKFYGLTVEGYDYGFEGVDLGDVSEGTRTSVFSIDKCYFEATGISHISLNSVASGRIMEYTVEINSCRFFGDAPLVLGTGSFSIVNNQEQRVLIDTTNNSTGRRIINTDYRPDLFELSNDKHQNTTVMVNFNSDTKNGNANKYNHWGDSNTHPSANNFLGTWQDNHAALIRRSLGNIDNNTPHLAKIPYAMTVNSTPITFNPTLESKAGPVIKGEDGIFYMIGTKNGTSLELTKVTNTYRLEPPSNGKTAKELYRDSSIAEGTAYFAIDILDWVRKQDGQWVFDKGNHEGLLAIGKTTDFIGKTYGSGYNNPKVWNVQINHGYRWHGNRLAWGDDWYGNYVVSNGNSVIGLIADRPTSPGIDGFIYYASDENKYYKWSNVSNTYTPYTPLF